MNYSKKNMIMLENEASLRGEGCTVPPKTRNTGRLLNSKIVRYVPISQNQIHHMLIDSLVLDRIHKMPHKKGRSEKLEDILMQLLI